MTNQYGAYYEILFLLSDGDIIKVKEILKENAHDVIYWAEYLIKKKMIENEELKKSNFNQ